jgi:cation diffusion facilitator family transporter
MTVDQIARRVALASILISAGLAAVKIVVGLMANSVAVVSDGFESAGDVLASGFVLFGLVYAAKPPDEEHPYGHGRAETLMGLLVGILLTTTGVLISYSSLERLSDVRHVPASFAIWAIVGSIAIKSITWSFKRRYGRKINSDALIADSWNDAVDILSGVTALIALSLALLNPVRLAAADHVGGFFVGLIVVFLGLHVVRDTTVQLMDTMPPPARMTEIRQVALSVPGALGVEKCFARKTGLKYHVDMHLEVDPALTVMASHDIATEVRTKVKKQLAWVADVLVHVEPYMR